MAPKQKRRGQESTHPSIHLMDVGAGRGILRARRFAEQNPNLRVVAVEPLADPKEHAHLTNLEVVPKPIEDYVVQVPTGSVGNLNFDFSLTYPEFYELAKKVHPNAPPAFHNIPLTDQLAREFHRMVHPEGRLTLLAPEEKWAREVGTRLKRAGFRVDYKDFRYRMLGGVESPAYNELVKESKQLKRSLDDFLVQVVARK